MKTLASTSFIYFRFEEDFVEDNVRCIPMVVRFKLDACGIKLKLSEWCKMTPRERENLATRPCETQAEVNSYRDELKKLIYTRTGNEATELPVIENPEWEIGEAVPFILQQKLKEFNWSITATQWKALTYLQRFALVKLSRGGHENINFPKAMKEFNLA